MLSTYAAQELSQIQTHYPSKVLTMNILTSSPPNGSSIRDYTHFHCSQCKSDKPLQTSGGTGYATNSNNSLVCYDCANVNELTAFKAANRYDAYLSNDGLKITTWTGCELAKVTRKWRTSAGGFASRTIITRIRATAADGSAWCGQGPGEGMYCRLTRLKIKA